MLRRRGQLLALPVLLAAGSARAESGSLETAALSWVRAESAASCPGAAEVARSIEQRLGRPALVLPSQAGLMVEAYVDGAPNGGFRVVITLARGETNVGRRELESPEPTCQAVAEKAALVIALTIDPEASVEPMTMEPPPLPPPPAQPEPPAPPPPPAPLPPPPKPPEPPTWQGDVELSGGVATGIVPELAPGLFARGRALPPELPFALELEGAYFPTKTLEYAPGKSADLTLFYAGAGVCSRPSRASRLRASLCVGADVGAVAGQGFGFTYTPRFRSWTYTLTAKGRLGYALIPQLAIVLGPDLFVPLKRDSFEVQPVTGTEQLFRMSALGLGFELGVVWEL